MRKPSDNRIAVLRAIADAPQPISSKEIAAIDALLDEERKVVSNLLFNMKKSGVVVADEQLRYSITAKGRAALGESGNGVSVPMDRSTPPQGKKLRKPDLSSAGVIEARLQRLVDESQETLQLYIASVVDPEIFAPLSQSLVNAKRSLAAHRDRKVK